MFTKTFVLKVEYILSMISICGWGRGEIDSSGQDCPFNIEDLKYDLQLDCILVWLWVLDKWFVWYLCSKWAIPVLKEFSFTDGDVSWYLMSLQHYKTCKSISFSSKGEKKNPWKWSFHRHFTKCKFLSSVIFLFS